MDKSLLKEIIIEQKDFIDNFDIGVAREVLVDYERYFKTPHIFIISGMRRVGKSTLLAQIINRFFKHSGYYFNFEDERLLNFESTDFNSLYELMVELFGERKIFFFDEIQNIGAWENFIRRMQDRKFKFFITGSNASLLSRELGTKLTGRYFPCKLYPFSFKEFLLFKKQEIGPDYLSKTVARGKIKGFFNEYLERGGMPEYLKYQNKEALKTIYEDIIFRDIAVRYDIKEVKSLRELTLYLLSNLGGLFSYNNLKGFLKLGSVNTVKSYIDYLENSFLIQTINLFSYSLKQQSVAPKKAYCIDNGMADAVSFSFSKNQGKFLENLVFGELRKGNKDIYYYKTKNNLEVDFLLREGRKAKQLIQVVWSLSNNQTKKREIKGLAAAAKELKLKEGLVLTNNEEMEIKENGINIIIKPVYKWLLNI